MYFFLQINELKQLSFKQDKFNKNLLKKMYLLIENVCLHIIYLFNCRLVTQSFYTHFNFTSSSFSNDFSIQNLLIYKLTR